MAHVSQIGIPVLCKEGERLHNLFEYYLFREGYEAFTDETIEAFYIYIDHRLDCKECKSG